MGFNQSREFDGFKFKLTTRPRKNGVQNKNKNNG